MVLPDVNVLIYAFRIESPFYVVCSEWLARTVNGDAQFGISPLALSALVRITTNRRTFPEPSTHDEAFDFCEDLMAQPNCQIIEPGERHWQIFRRLCVDANITGPAYPTSGTPPSPSSMAANGLRWIAISDGSPA
jgi:predicted nucleic acid-binding protein